MFPFFDSDFQFQLPCSKPAMVWAKQLQLGICIYTYIYICIYIYVYIYVYIYMYIHIQLSDISSGASSVYSNSILHSPRSERAAGFLTLDAGCAVTRNDPHCHSITG